jgi:hypothetical protein
MMRWVGRSKHFAVILLPSDKIPVRGVALFSHDGRHQKSIRQETSRGHNDSRLSFPH